MNKLGFSHQKINTGDSKIGGTDFPAYSDTVYSDTGVSHNCS